MEKTEQKAKMTEQVFK